MFFFVCLCRCLCVCPAVHWPCGIWGKIPVGWCTAVKVFFTSHLALSDPLSALCVSFRVHMKVCCVCSGTEFLPQNTNVRACLSVSLLFVTMLSSVFSCHFVWLHGVTLSRACCSMQAGNVLTSFVQLYIRQHCIYKSQKKGVLLTIPFVCLRLVFVLSVSVHVRQTLSVSISPPLFISIQHSLFSLLFQLPCHITIFSIFWWLFSSFPQICPHPVPCGFQQGSGNPPSVGCKKEWHSSAVGSSSALGNKYYVHSQVTHTVCTPWLMWALMCALLYYYYDRERYLAWSHFDCIYWASLTIEEGIRDIHIAGRDHIMICCWT